ncbi:9991_t:CDS:1, partial [Acaulospora morrowiae]
MPLKFPVRAYVLNRILDYKFNPQNINAVKSKWFGNNRSFATTLSNNEKPSGNAVSEKTENIYDIVIVGGGISGSALACAL